MVTYGWHWTISRERAWAPGECRVYSRSLSEVLNKQHRTKGKVYILLKNLNFLWSVLSPSRCYRPLDCWIVEHRSVGWIDMTMSQEPSSSSKATRLTVFHNISVWNDWIVGLHGEQSWQSAIESNSNQRNSPGDFLQQLSVLCGVQCSRLQLTTYCKEMKWWFGRDSGLSLLRICRHSHSEVTTAVWSRRTLAPQRLRWQPQ